MSCVHTQSRGLIGVFTHELARICYPRGVWKSCQEFLRKLTPPNWKQKKTLLARGSSINRLDSFFDRGKNTLKVIDPYETRPRGREAQISAEEYSSFSRPSLSCSQTFSGSGKKVIQFPPSSPRLSNALFDCSFGILGWLHFRFMIFPVFFSFRIREMGSFMIFVRDFVVYIFFFPFLLFFHCRWLGMSLKSTLICIIEIRLAWTTSYYTRPWSIDIY